MVHTPLTIHMNFEPQRVLKSVHDFYISSGIADPAQETVLVKPCNIPVLDGDRQKYEQINLFVFGHLVPDFTPVIVSLELKGSYVRTIFELPKASNSAYHTLFEDLSQDTRLDKINQSCQARLRTSLEPPLLILDFPARHNTDGSLPPLDREELRNRFETLSAAASLLEGYVSNGKRHLALIERAAENKEWEEAFRHIHALKGGALNLCATQLTNACKDLETALRQKDIVPIPELFQKVHLQFERLASYYESNKESFNA